MHKPKPGAVVLASMGRVAEPVLRRYSEDAGQHWLLADDARWPVIKATNIIGCVVEVTQRRILM